MFRSYYGAIDGLSTGALVTGNIIHNNGMGGGSGINCDGVQSSTISNNLLYNNHASGLSLFRINASAGSKNDGTFDQTQSGPSGITIGHVFTDSGMVSLRIEAIDSFGISSLVTTASVNVTAAALQTDPFDGTKSALIVGGSTGNDTITLKPADNRGGITVTINGASAGTFTPTGHILAFAQAGDDTIKETSQKITGTMYFITLPGFFFGGEGNETLDLTASWANNVLAGETGNDQLRGGSGRDILLGGSGSDSLYAGGQDAILVSGATDFDSNMAALSTLMAEWSRADDYLTRVHHLDGSMAGGNNGSIYLNAATIHDDRVADYLFGNSQVLDWFFANSTGPIKDSVNGVRSGAIVTGIV